MLRLIDGLGYDTDEFEFVKNESWICIYHEPSNRYYGYKRRRQVLLNPLLQKWRGEGSYKVKKGNSEIIKLDGARNPGSLMREFENWVGSIEG